MCTAPGDASAQARPIAQSAPLYRSARAPHAAGLENALQRARLAEQLGASMFPDGFSAICERTRSLRLSADNPAVREGRRRALDLLARRAATRLQRLRVALLELEQLRRSDPTNAAVLQLRARLLMRWEEPGPRDPCDVQRRSADAIAALEELHARHPGLQTSASAIALGELLIRQRSYARAIAVLRRAVTLAFDAADSSRAYARLAEATMLSGDAAGALPFYERALVHAGPLASRPQSGGGVPARAGSDRPSVALLKLGMAVAHARLGERVSALELAEHGMEAAGRSLDVLRPDRVQFDPPEERYVYEALAHEALARLLPEARALSLEAAASGYAAFLSGSDVGNSYRNAAESDLRAVRRELELIGPRAEREPQLHAPVSLHRDWAAGDQSGARSNTAEAFP